MGVDSRQLVVAAEVRSRSKPWQATLLTACCLASLAPPAAAAARRRRLLRAASLPACSSLPAPGRPAAGCSWGWCASSCSRPRALRALPCTTSCTCRLPAQQRSTRLPRSSGAAPARPPCWCSRRAEGAAACPRVELGTLQRRRLAPAPAAPAAHSAAAAPSVRRCCCRLQPLLALPACLSACTPPPTPACPNRFAHRSTASGTESLSQ